MQVGEGHLRSTWGCLLSEGVSNGVVKDFPKPSLKAPSAFNSRNYIHNEEILTDVQLACAMRWFAGRSIYNIMTAYGIDQTDAINSCWYVMDAVSSRPNFKITYPEEHDKQQSIVQGFRRVSGANFACYARAIIGILIWVHRPREKDCIESGCSAG